MIISHASDRSEDLIGKAPEGLVCAAGDFVIDPQRPVPRAVITHAHADHARPGSEMYYATRQSVPILRKRLGRQAIIAGVDYGEPLRFGRTTVSFHSAGHVLGSAQIRVSCGDEVWVVTGDFKRDADPTCAPFEPVPCDVLISEATFALPIYRWPPGQDVAREVRDWWRVNADNDRPSVLFCYSFGKAQRVLAELAGHTERPVLLHGAVQAITELYDEAGVTMAPHAPMDLRTKRDYAGELVIAPPGAAGSTWMRRFRRARTGFCSGWMRVRGNRRRRGYDRGFVLSDHADWPALLQTIEDCAPRRVLLTHGHADTLVRFLNKRGQTAEAL
ncbi:MAG: ligase-associated DNA damage response exonuclease [Pseudomonadota bacterium]